MLSNPTTSSSITDIQLSIRENAHEYQKVVQELSEWESSINNQPPSSIENQIANTKIPPIRGTQRTTNSNPRPPPIKKTHSKVPRQYQDWDKLDIEAILTDIDSVQIADQSTTHPESPTKDPESSSTSSNNADLALIEKETGNLYYQKHKYQKAIQYYTKAILLDATNPTYFLNRAACYLKLTSNNQQQQQQQHHYAQLAEDDCSCALLLAPKSVKALYRRACARVQLHKSTDAVLDLDFAIVLDPTNADCKQLRTDIHLQLHPPSIPPSRKKLAITEINKPVGVCIPPNPVSDEFLLNPVSTTRTNVPEPPYSPPAAVQEIPSEISPLLLQEPPTSSSIPMDMDDTRTTAPLAANVNEVMNSDPLRPTMILHSLTNGVASEPAKSPESVVITPPKRIDPEPPTPSRLPTPKASFELRMHITELVHRNELPASITDRDVKDCSSVGDYARNYLLAIRPIDLVSIFKYASMDSDVLAYIIIILGSFAPDNIHAPLMYNYLYCLSQCPRFSIACRLLPKTCTLTVKQIFNELDQVYLGNESTIVKLTNLKNAWGL